MGKKERKLTQAELKRKENYEKVCDEMVEKGYKQKELTVGVILANVVAIISLCCLLRQ